MASPSRPLAGLVAPLRNLALAGLRDALGGEGEPLQLGEPLGDPGLFGPSSQAWQVHSDLGCMLIGGFSALMVQMLHPLAMAGVAQHSRYREDPLGRLRSTARYVAGTTYGAMPLVERLVAEVEAVHAQVQGVARDGRPYRADDPHLLAFVHTSEVWGFLSAYQRYGPRPLLRREKDAYLEEVAVLAELLGATQVPRSVAEVRDYFRQVRPELALSPEAKEAFSFLLRPLGGSLADVVAHRVLTQAAIELLPGFAKELLGLSSLAERIRLGIPPGAGRLATRLAAAGLTSGLRLALGPSPARAAATERVCAGKTLASRERAYSGNRLGAR
jgi:uncharacterized protein (DUF2236 family)